MSQLLTLFPIVFYPVLNIIILFLLGFGLTYLIIPKNLKNYILWLSPWTAIVVSIFYLVILSLFGLSVKQTFLPLIMIFFIADIYVLTKLKPVFNFSFKENFLLLVFVGATLILNLSPLIVYDKMLTSVSMGNNDIIVYTDAGDYLKDHSIAESFKTNTNVNVGTLLVAGYRWGPPAINSFFLVIFNLHGYQYTYISQTVLFSLFLPLVYLLFITLYKKPSTVGLITSGIFTGFNANLLYILYHDFFGQVLFWGIALLILIFLYTYLISLKVKKALRPKRNYFKTLFSQLNRNDIILGILITVLYMSYHEGAVFLFAPLLIFLAVAFFLKRNLFNDYFQALLRIASISLITGFYIIIHGTINDYQTKILADPNQPIGWQLFRNNLPFPNPFEAMGFWSIHNFDPMPTILAITVSVVTILVIIKGFQVSKGKILTISYLTIFIFFLYWTGLYQRNFFAYYRALTYTLPFIIVIFSIGLTHLFEKQKKIGIITMAILISFELWSVVHFNIRFIKEHLSVGKSYASILDLQNKKINGIIYAEAFMKNDIPLWIQIWTGYFLYSKGISSVPAEFNNTPYENRIPDSSFVLISKPTPWFIPLHVVLTDTVWENAYYKLGRICNEDDCLMNYKDNLNDLKIGKNNYEDSLLISGWNTPETDSRWANEKTSTLRLVTKDNNPKKLVIKALTPKKPQELTVYLDGKLLDRIAVDTEWKRYEIPVDQELTPGIHKIKFTYANGYKLKDIIPGSTDNRTLYINFREIKLE